MNCKMFLLRGQLVVQACKFGGLVELVQRKYQTWLHPFLKMLNHIFGIFRGGQGKAPAMMIKSGK